MSEENAIRLKKIFAKNLNYYLQKKGVDKRTFAKEIDTPYFTVVDWAKGAKYPRMDKVERIANYFNITMSDLIEEKGNRTSPQDEVWEMRAELQQRPELKVLFDMSKKATKEDVEKAIQMMEIFISKK